MSKKANQKVCSIVCVYIDCMIANTDQGVNRSKIYSAKVHALSIALRLIADKADQGWQIVDRLFLYVILTEKNQTPKKMAKKPTTKSQKR